MNLKTFLETLTEVELSQHVFGMLNEKEKLLKYYELVNLINRGINHIHNRFLIKKGEILINISNNDSYRHSIIDEDYILTADTPLSVIKILEVWNEEGDRVKLNTHHRSYNKNYFKEESIQMVDKTTLVFDGCQGCYRIIFQRGPILLKKDEKVDLFCPDKLEIDLPLEYIDALIYYVASRLFSVTLPMEGNAAQFSPSILYSSKFEQECQRLNDMNLEIEGTEDSSQRFADSMFP